MPGRSFGDFVSVPFSVFPVSACYKHGMRRGGFVLRSQFFYVGSDLYCGGDIYYFEYLDQTEDNKGMALEGSLKDFGLADILQLIYFQRKTGVLTFVGKMDRVRLIFIDGNIAGAESKRRMEDNRLGKILLKKGHLSEENLAVALEEQRKTGAKLGNILIQTELIEKETIKDILEGQITETIIQLFGWEQGTYEFTVQGVPWTRICPFPWIPSICLWRACGSLMSGPLYRARSPLTACLEKWARPRQD